MQQRYTLADEIILLHKIKEAFDSDRPLTSIEKMRALKEVTSRLEHLEYFKGTSWGEIPNNISKMFEYLQTKPLSRYLPELSNGLEEESQEEVALSDEGILSDIAQDLILNHTADEQIENYMLTLREKIVELGIEGLYERCRFFFCAENTLDSRAKLELRLKKAGIPTTLWTFILNTFYHQIPAPKEVKLCPICGEPWKPDHFNQSKVCHFFRQREMQDLKPLKKQFESDELVYQLNKGVITFVVKPNIGERCFRDKVINLGCEIEMYPYHDEYDFKIEAGERLYFLDMKDYTYPQRLVNYIENHPYLVNKLQYPDRSEVQAENIYLIVPEHRLAISKQNYLKILKDGLAPKFKIQVISEEEFLNHLKKLKGE